MPSTKNKIEFISDGNKISGVLETPAEKAHAYVIFAHCFTCGKDVLFSTRITKALTQNGFAVLRFDFTGLGESEGNFSNTNFSSNVNDLVTAAAYLRDNYQAPSLLIGHSLGGRAVLSAAAKIPEIKALVTIGAPADSHHLTHLFTSQIDDIMQSGSAEIAIGSRKFNITKQFLDDIKENRNDIESLKVPLLVMHSPIDEIVPIKEAEKIYQRAKHPKSFITLDTANHLVTDKNDTEYVANIISAWSQKYLSLKKANTKPIQKVAEGDVVVNEFNKNFTRLIQSDEHQWLADEPTKVNGDNLGPDPYELLLAALGACTSMTLRMYANRKNLSLDDVKVTLRHSRQHGSDCQYCDSENKKIEVLSRELEITGDLTDAERQRLVEIADLCPVHKTIEGKVVITTELKKSAD